MRIFYDPQGAQSIPLHAMRTEESVNLALNVSAHAANPLSAYLFE